MSLLEVEGLEVVYERAIVALRGIDLRIERDGGVAVLGPNGAGKSSLMRTLAGWHRPARGRIRFDGRDITMLPPEARARLGIGYVPEGGRIFARLTVRENLLMGGYLLDRPARHIERALAPFPVLHERLDQLAGTLSGGERQMLAIARAVMSRPRLLLVDEVSLGLMPQAVATVFAALAGLREQGTALLLAEQNARKAMEIVDRVHLLENGRFVLAGEPAAIADDPRVVAVYLGGEAG